jgi:N-acetyl-gamma-glutamyl-phosphate reductase
MSRTGHKSVGLVGARGYVGTEIIDLIKHHPYFALKYASSRALAGEYVDNTTSELRFTDLAPHDVARAGADIIILALPDNHARPYVEALNTTAAEKMIIDLSGDHRFDDAWAYGLPEHERAQIKNATRIANPGCYATAMQLALYPLRNHFGGKPVCFGISGYSGAGTKPSPRNNKALLAENIMPYGLQNHLHEREVSRHLGTDIAFMPHVAGFFRGLNITAHIPLSSAMSMDEIIETYNAFYGDEPLVDIVPGAAPEISSVTNTKKAAVGGFTLSADQQTLVTVAVLDNLLKGAASQAIQNMNLASGYAELTGI